MKAHYDKDDVNGRIRGVCRLPIEVIYSPSHCGFKPSLRVWLGQGDGKAVTRQDLLDYAKEAREWANIMETIAKDVVL